MKQFILRKFSRSLLLQIAVYVFLSHVIFLAVIGVVEYLEIKEYTDMNADANLLKLAKTIDVYINYRVEKDGKPKTAEIIPQVTEKSKGHHFSKYPGLDTRNIEPPFFRVYDTTGNILYVSNSQKNVLNASNVKKELETLGGDNDDNEDDHDDESGFNMPDPAELIFTEGFYDLIGEKRIWRRLIYENNAGGYFVEVIQRDKFDQKILSELREILLSEFSWAFFLIPIIVWVSVKFSLRNLRKSASQIGRLSPDHLQPVSQENTPYEILPIIMAMNRLIRQIEQALTNIRQFTANASHELRTPLAAIRVNIEAAKFSTKKENRIEAMDNALLGIDQATALVEKLLIISRYDSESSLAFEQTDLRIIASDVIQALYSTIINADKDIELICEEKPYVVNGNPEAIRMIMRNLIDNAIRYTPPTKMVKVVLIKTTQNVVCEVHDEGPGVPENLRERIFERFYRAESTRRENYGLGLSLVKKLAELHHTKPEVRTGDNNTGSVFSVSFPL